jgi:peptidoglycan/LPS O-acetylase OafA/YrhL
MKTLKYRKEIDGLRALAVLSVVFFHAGIDFFSGGFVGVDIFFVISGYLIATLIISEIRSGKFSLLNFYERRARRLLPALFTVMLCSIPFAWFLMIPSLLKDFGQSLVATNLFISNFLFWIESDYFATSSEMKPLLHAWSLSVEEQFYLIFPIFLLCFWRTGIGLITFLLISISILSFSLTIFGDETYCCSPYFINSITSFYLPFGRIWELLIGVLCALILLEKKEQAKCSNLFSILGLSLIVFSIIYFDEEKKFPGVYTLFPTIGTALLILFCNPNNYLGKFFSIKSLVFIGLISYSLYLWHFVIFVFARYIFINPPEIIFYFLILPSIFIAYLSWRFIEMPFRNRDRFNRHQIFTFSFLGIISISIFGLIIIFQDGFEERYEIDQDTLLTIERSLKDNECFDNEYFHLPETEKWGCSLGIKRNNYDFLITGDSHAYSLIDMLESALKESKTNAFFTGTASCPPLVGIHNNVRGITPNQNIITGWDESNIQNCYLLNEKIFKFVRKEEIKDIFFIARWSIYTVGDHNGNGMFYIGSHPNYIETSENSIAAFSIAFKQTIEMYKDIGVNVHVITEAPLQNYDSEYIYYRSYNEDDNLFRKKLEQYSVSFDAHLKQQKFVLSIFDQHLPNGNLYIWNYDSIFCEDLCLVGNTRKSFYYDDDHLSISGSNLLKKEFIEKFNLLAK